MSEQKNIDMSVITCPNCQASYNIASDAVGEDGRQVKCAKCQQSWKAVVPQPEVVPLKEAQAEQEALMDEAFEAISPEKAVNISDEVEKNPKNSQKQAVTKPEAKSEGELQKDIARRKTLLARTMPKARLNRSVRIMGAVLLTIVLLSVVFLRENIVRTFPAAAGLYGAVGVGVNVVGLDFFEVETLLMLREGVEVMDISADIFSVSSRQVSVPKIIVTLLDEANNSIFEWSVTSRAAIMLPGEWIEFETQLNSPPDEAKMVRLTFENIN